MGVASRVSNMANYRSRSVGLCLILLIVLVIYMYRYAGSDLETSTTPPIENIRLNNITTSRTTSVRPASKPLCTFAVFREYYREFHRFPTGGSWNLDPDTPTFEPDLCRFEFSRISAAKVGQSLVTDGVRYVFASGDSNGNHNFEQLSNFTFASNCSVVRDDRKITKVSDDYLMNRKYLTFDPEWTPYMHHEGRGRHSMTDSREFSCGVGGNNKVNFEYFSGMSAVDKAIQISPPPKATSNIPTISSSQEFLFKYYLSNRPPDLQVVNLPLNHEKQKPIPQSTTRIRKYHELLKRHRTARRVLVLPAFCEFEKKRLTKAAKWKNRRFSGLLATEVIDKLNQFIYKTFQEDLLDPEQRTYGFLDLLDISRNLSSWSLDGVHMRPVWYQAVMDMVWQTFYNSVTLDAF